MFQRGFFKKIKLQVLLWLVLSSASLSATDVLIVTDADFDDLIAITWLVEQPGVCVKGVVVEGTGWSHHSQGSQNVLDVLAHVGAKGIPVVAGAKEPLEGPKNTIPEDFRNQADSLWGISLSKSEASLESASAPDFIVNLLKNNPSKVRVIALSPITSLGKAMLQDPKITDTISELYITARPPAQRKYPDSIQLDMRAAEIVFQSSFPIYLVHVNQEDNPPDEYWIKKLQKQGNSPASKLAADLLLKMSKEKDQEDDLWDVITTIVAFHPEIATWEKVGWPSREGGCLLKRTTRLSFPQFEALFLDGISKDSCGYSLK